MSQTLSTGSTEMNGRTLLSRRPQSTRRDEHVQTDIYNTMGNCYRIGLFKGL